ncbi:MAG: 4-vinyl reductase [Candidatus Diapherotrites archaeon]|nr:4-vinyl reductase [Candidatus Diapherotrites archaeon]
MVMTYDFISKMMLVKQLKLEKGNISFFNDRFVMMPSSLISNLQQQVDNQLPQQIYNVSKDVGFKNFSNTLKAGVSMNRTEYMGLIFNLLNSHGDGIYNIDSIDFAKMQAIVSLDGSAVASNYGKTKHPVDHVARGMLAGAFSLLFNEPNIEALEHQCLASGDKECSFLIKKRETFDKNSDLFKYQLAVSQPNQRGHFWW